MATSTRFDIDPIGKVSRDIRRGLQAGASANHVRGMLRQWGVRYLRQTEKHYDEQSRGGGDWPALKPSTVRGRRKGGKKRGGTNTIRVKKAATGGSVAILKDTGSMRRALRRGSPGNLFQDINAGVRVGFGPVGHPGGGVTYQQLATWHQDGAGRLPKREIFKAPDSTTRHGMMADAKRALQRILAENRLRGVSS